ncbi:aldo/keto reductase [Microbacterium deminutum]|uniref:Aldo/keto reductase n=1 Tax=Microbacterium deminutum TaxID=344164 RepID=A0ABP5CY53_9MICO
MLQRQIAPGVEVSALSLGSYHTYDRMEHDQIVEFLRSAVDSGVTFYDVGYYAPAAIRDYPGSDTDVRFAAARVEAGIRRDEYFHSQKLWYGPTAPRFVDQLAISLPRAGVDAADCVVYNASGAYYFREFVDLKDIATQMAGLVQSGLTKFWAIDVITASELDELCSFADKEGLPLPAFLQTPYSLVAREWVEGTEMVDVLTKWNVPLQPNNVLGFGLLAGKDASNSGRPMGPTHLTEHAELVSAQVAAAAESVNATPAQLAIAFALANPQTLSVLFGASSTAQLEEDLGAVDLFVREGADRIREVVSSVPQDPEQVITTGEPFIDISSYPPRPEVAEATR